MLHHANWREHLIYITVLIKKPSTKLLYLIINCWDLRKKKFCYACARYHKPHLAGLWNIKWQTWETQIHANSPSDLLLLWLHEHVIICWPIHKLYAIHVIWTYLLRAHVSWCTYLIHIHDTVDTPTLTQQGFLFLKEAVINIMRLYDVSQYHVALWC